MTAFTTRHFRLIAEVLGRARLHEDVRLALTDDFAAAFEQDNPNFDRDRFITAVLKAANRADAERGA